MQSLFFRAAVIAAVTAGLAGCGGGSSAPPAVAPPPPTSGATLTIACADPAFAKAVADRANGWGGRSGAAIRVESKPPAAASGADLAVIRPAELGELAAAGKLVPLPQSLQAVDHPLQWPRIASVFRQNLTGWGGQVQGIPLAGDGFVLIYRSDRFSDPATAAAFQKKVGRPLAPPATWEDAAEVAEFFATTAGKPSLPPVPTDPDRLLAEYHHVAACYDRPAMTDTDLAATKGAALVLGFHTDPATGAARIGSPGFRAAAGWLGRVAKFRATGPDDPVAALSTGPAAFGVLSLAEVGRLPKGPDGAVDARFGVAPIPGSRAYFGPDAKPRLAARGVNLVPYLGGGGWVGVVFGSSPNQQAAWELLADLASPASATALLSNPALGVGPFRTEHVSAERTAQWQRYGFDADRNRALAAAVREYVGLGLVNPALALRTPDQQPLMAALADAVRKAATGQVPAEQAIDQAVAAWKAHDAGVPADELKKWRRNAAGQR